MGAAAAELQELVAEIKKASANISDSDARVNGRIDQIKKSGNELFKKVSRPAFSAERDDDDLARKDATQLCIINHALVVPKNDGNTAEYVPLNSTLPGSCVRAR